MRLLIILTVYLFPFFSNGQIRTIVGKVVDESDLTSIPGVMIQTRDTVQLGATDLMGNFKIELPTGADELLISFIGMEWTSIKVAANCDTLEVIMMVDAIYDFVTIETENRERYKRFKKLKDRHREAFKKGIFKSKEPCITYNYKKH